MNENVTIDGLPYAFPKNDILNIVFPTQGKTFIRLEPPGESFLLVKDEGADRKQEATGKTIISKINSSRFRKVEEFYRDGIQVFCKESPFFSCGTQIEDQGIKWSVIFNRSDVKNVANIKDRAQRVLMRYRGR